MEQYENPNLLFINYNKQDQKQVEFVSDINNDDEITKMIDNIVNDIDSNYTFLVKDLSLNKFVGLFYLKLKQYGEDTASLSFAVHKNYRHNNKKYGTNILKMINTILPSHNNINKIVLEISSNNPNSIKAAKNAGFLIDTDLFYSFNDEGYPFVPYAIKNQNYVNKNTIVSSIR